MKYHMPAMKVLGIDPGTHKIGWGIIVGNASNQRPIDYGCIQLPAHTKKDIYLETAYTEIAKIVKKHKPDLVAIEKLFFQKNKKTAISVAQARGVIMLALTKSKTPIIELAPNTIKANVAGIGNATKNQVAQMVNILLNLENGPKQDDTSDALATAICGLAMEKIS